MCVVCAMRRSCGGDVRVCACFCAWAHGACVRWFVCLHDVCAWRKSATHATHSMQTNPHACPLHIHFVSTLPVTYPHAHTAHRHTPRTHHAHTKHTPRTHQAHTKHTPTPVGRTGRFGTLGVAVTLTHSRYPLPLSHSLPPPHIAHTHIHVLYNDYLDDTTTAPKIIQPPWQKKPKKIK